MKKRIALLMISAVFLVIAAGCGKEPAAQGNTIDAVPEILSQEEYILYQNVFYSDFGKKLEGASMTKKGVLAVVQDAFSLCTRYYVWGYMDSTKCCDWQWEFVPEDPERLPQPGSLITVKGRFAAGSDALDGYWIEKAAVETNAAYVGEAFELDMCAMSCTLERVQMLNIMYKPDHFAKKTFAAYGRIAAPGTLEDPYYDGSWQIGYAPEDSSFAIGTQVVVHGSVINGKLSGCTVTKSE